MGAPVIVSEGVAPRGSRRQVLWLGSSQHPTLSRDYP